MRCNSYIYLFGSFQIQQNVASHSNLYGLSRITSSVLDVVLRAMSLKSGENPSPVPRKVT